MDFSSDFMSCGAFMQMYRTVKSTDKGTGNKLDFPFSLFLSFIASIMLFSPFWLRSFCDSSVTETP